MDYKDKVGLYNENNVGLEEVVTVFQYNLTPGFMQKFRPLSHKLIVLSRWKCNLMIAFLEVLLVESPRACLCKIVL